METAKPDLSILPKTFLDAKNRYAKAKRQYQDLYHAYQSKLVAGTATDDDHKAIKLAWWEANDADFCLRGEFLESLAKSHEDIINAESREDTIARINKIIKWGRRLLIFMAFGAVASLGLTTIGWYQVLNSPNPAQPSATTTAQPSAATKPQKLPPTKTKTNPAPSTPQRK